MSENKYNYKTDLLARLADAHYAELYLDAAARESRGILLLAMRDVAEAQKGLSQLAVDADVNRENLYRALSEEGNPRLSTFDAVLDALGMKYTISRKTVLTNTLPPGPGTYILTASEANVAVTGATVTTNVSAQVSTNKQQDYMLIPIENYGIEISGFGPQPAGNSQLARVA